MAVSILAMCGVNSDKVTPEASKKLFNVNQSQLQLTGIQRKRWAGKRYLVLIEIEQFAELEPFPIDKSGIGNMDDWLPVGTIDTVRTE